MSAPARQPGPAQLLVRDTMLRAGGYWRPLAAVARLLEELGELAELLGRDERDPAELAGELADLWIITSALADQFLAGVPDPSGGAPSAEPGVGPALSAAGEIARVVNYYDGPKTPRAGAKLPSLAHAVSAFHLELERLAGGLGLDLRAAVEAKLSHVRASADMSRFERDGSDPSTSAAAVSFRAAPGRTHARVWGAPDAGVGAELLGAAIGPSLLSFAKAAGPEALEAYIVIGPELAGEERAVWIETLLAGAGAEPLAGAREEGRTVRLGGHPIAWRTLEDAREGFFLVLEAAG